MYNVKGPSKIVAKTTRRGLVQNIETFRDHSRSKLNESEENEVNNGPKPIFQNMSKKFSNQKQKHMITPQHAELIKYVNDSWNSVCNAMELSNSASDGSSSPNSEHSVVYYEDEPCTELQNFKPFDLESWWGKRLYTYITNSVNTKG